MTNICFKLSSRRFQLIRKEIEEFNQRLNILSLLLLILVCVSIYVDIYITNDIVISSPYVCSIIVSYLFSIGNYLIIKRNIYRSLDRRINIFNLNTIHHFKSPSVHIVNRLKNYLITLPFLTFGLFYILTTVFCHIAYLINGSLTLCCIIVAFTSLLQFILLISIEVRINKTEKI